MVSPGFSEPGVPAPSSLPRAHHARHAQPPSRDGRPLPHELPGRRPKGRLGAVLLRGMAAPLLRRGARAVSLACALRTWEAAVLTGRVAEHGSSAAAAAAAAAGSRVLLAMLRSGLIKHDATDLEHALRRWGRAALAMAAEARLVRAVASRDAAAAQERARAAAELEQALRESRRSSAGEVLSVQAEAEAVMAAERRARERAEAKAEEAAEAAEGALPAPRP